jgi:hypothetical protein
MATMRILDSAAHRAACTALWVSLAIMAFPTAARAQPSGMCDGCSGMMGRGGGMMWAGMAVFWLLGVAAIAALVALTIYLIRRSRIR